MAGSNSNQLPSSKLRPEQIRHDYRGQETLPSPDYATCRDLEGRGREVELP